MEVEPLERKIDNSFDISSNRNSLNDKLIQSVNTIKGNILYENFDVKERDEYKPYEEYNCKYFKFR